jgi:hypothetical protein
MCETLEWALKQLLCLDCFKAYEDWMGCMNSWSNLAPYVCQPSLLVKCVKWDEMMAHGGVLMCRTWRSLPEKVRSCSS